MNNGIVVGEQGTILRTTDGGQNWISQSSGTYTYLYGVAFTDINNGTVVGLNGTILNTTDGGQNWTLNSADHLFGFSQFPLQIQITELLLVRM